MSKKGHHGGAWKVAYADFVTAMMALFLCLWLTAQDEKIKEAVERAFRHPFTSVTKQSVGIIDIKEKPQALQNSGNFDSASAVELAMLRRLNQDLLASLERTEEDVDNTVKLELTPEGLRVSIFDRSRRPIFEPDDVKLTPYGSFVFSTLAWTIARYPNFIIELEGHTERGQRVLRENYDAWELTADRANTARRTLLQHGVLPSQIRKVAGFADIQPMPNYPPEDEINRRVSVLLKIEENKRR